ncbi:MAG: MmcQ/YjbR family DNA-binding protein [Candidatus Nomurabacteria bacterium]|nr:MAG: MmcQ/YjbR family DNA-binding protein [Candidatus Nomurabacteria bacterium]HRV75962.1 MmcQ/YjbR family DNA-binding protein [Candidatus Saccharimonadales bacterium]
MTHGQEIRDYLLAKPNAWLDFPFGPEAEVYKVGEGDKAKMFAIIQSGKDPVNLSLKCDPNLAEHLREKFITVMPGYHLNKKHWNTIVCSGEVSEQDLKDLIDLSYRLVTE